MITSSKPATKQATSSERGVEHKVKSQSFDKDSKVKNKDKAMVVPGSTQKEQVLPATSTVAHTTELVEHVLGYLSYRDLRIALSACKFFRDVAKGSPSLRKALFFEPNYEAAHEPLPVRRIGDNPFPQPEREGFPYYAPRMFEFTFEDVERLMKAPRLDILDSLILQPPYRRAMLHFNMSVPSLPLSETQSFQEMSNSEGIKLEDILDFIHKQMEKLVDTLGSAQVKFMRLRRSTSLLKPS